MSAAARAVTNSSYAAVTSPHRAFGGIARRPEDISGHARLADQILPLEVVPDRKRNRQRELREVRGGRRVELLVEPYPRGRQADARQVRAQPSPEDRRRGSLVGAGL